MRRYSYSFFPQSRTACLYLDGRKVAEAHFESNGEMSDWLLSPDHDGDRLKRRLSRYVASTLALRERERAFR